MPADQHTLDTLQHKRAVARFLRYIISDLYDRAITHDDTKFSDEEYDLYAQVVPRLKEVPFGSDEYKAIVRELDPGIEHHVKSSRHHVQYHKRGIEGMHLVDLLEMVVDWKAASMRPPANDVKESLPWNFGRFKIEPQLAAVIRNTIDFLEHTYANDPEDLY